MYVSMYIHVHKCTIYIYIYVCIYIYIYIGRLDVLPPRGRAGACPPLAAARGGAAFSFFKCIFFTQFSIFF